MLCFLGSTLGGFAEAQDNARLDELLGQAPAHLDEACYLILASAGEVPETASAAEAFTKAASLGLVESHRKPTDGVTLQDLSFWVMKVLKVPGGLEWTVSPNPRAAYRELSYLSLINTSDGPDRLVAGDEVVRTLSAVREYRDSHR
jgi:hypothetical protein